MNKLVLLLMVVLTTLACTNNSSLEYADADVNVLFLHHSTGHNVIKGKAEALAKISSKFEKYALPILLADYNEENNTKIAFEERYFPKGNPYPWNNYPYDYYNIWVKNAGSEEYMEEPTLEILTPDYDVIVFKHCFPVSNILEDDSIPSVDSEKKTIANYKLQYDTLKAKLKEFPETKFIVWTGAAHVATQTNEEEAFRAKEFFEWVMKEWDEPNDNIYIYDFRSVETDGGLYLKNEYAVNDYDSHPNDVISDKAVKLFVNRIVDVIQNDGQKTNLKGEQK